MKKLIVAILIGALATGLISCGKTKQAPTETTKEESSSKKNEGTKTEEPTVKFPEGQSEIGKGKITVSTPAGTSENGNVPVLFVEKDAVIIQIGLIGENLDGTKQCYIYINKKFQEKIQMGEHAQISLNLSKELLKPGIYTVTVVEFDNNEPNGKVTEYHETKYEIKE